MNHSLNEIEALSKRAARGAGMAWGMAEEAGKAVRWLESHHLPGVALLAELLTLNDRVPHSQIAPQSLEGVWSAASGTLCPLIAGAALNDCADRLEGEQKIEMSNVSHPLLAVPFAAWAAIHIGAPVRVSWAGGHIDSDGYGIWAEHSPDFAAASDLTVTCATDHSTPAQTPALRGDVCLTSWDKLSRFAHRTYAPASDASRALGAGAGATDND